MNFSSAPLRRSTGFTLVEMLVSMTILALLMLMLLSITNSTQKTWSFTTGKIEQFRAARDGFESITRRVSQATLNTYLDYVDASGNGPGGTVVGGASTSSSFVPANYVRQSELRFISGPASTGSNSLGVNTGNPTPTHAIFFQAPLGSVSDTSDYGGLVTLLNTCGYYVEFGPDTTYPAFLAGLLPMHYRFRLMEMVEPSENFSLYNLENLAGGNTQYAKSGTSGTWYTNPLGSAGNSTGYSHVLAENVIALVILPKLSANDEKALGYNDGSLSPNYFYSSTPQTPSTDPNLDSHNQLPPVVQITMVAVDEASFSRYIGTSTTMPDFGLNGLFLNVGGSVNPQESQYAKDLQTLETTLQTNKLNYRVFTTEVSIKAAKWSREQTQ